jgi:branched-chain amino acid transport system ATP-binding protein
LATDDAPILSLHGVVGGYGKVTILNGTTFDVARGAITTVIGPNGAGKSTVFKAIFGLLPLRAGRIVFDGQDVTGFTPARLLELGISYVPQGRNVFPELSVLDNLELGGYSATRSVNVAERIEQVLARFPVLRQKAHTQVSTMSGGQQKLLEIARALLLDPKLLLIDEPSIGLSPLMVQETFAILADMRSRGVSVLMVEQNAKSALQHSDYGLVLELGETRLHDRAAAILADPRVGQLFLGGGMAAAPATPA